MLCSAGVQGLSALITALPVGWLADKWPRSRIIAIGGLADCFAIVITGYVVICGGPLWMLMVGLVLWGIVNTTTYGPSQALYADSVPTGERSRLGPQANYRSFSPLLCCCCQLMLCAYCIAAAVKCCNASA
jgi:MFS family permease